MIQKDIEIAAKEYAQSTANDKLQRHEPTSIPYSHDVYMAFIAGAQWMMKK